jgi:NADPH:quinone reductase-like Zn-dependent oxidoreductase
MATGHASPFMTDNYVPSHSRGVYFGGFEQSLYEKSVILMGPSKSQVLVKVHAVGLNPVDAKHVIGDKLPYHWTTLRRNSHNLLVKDTRVGFDFSGTVLQENLPKFPKGTRVFGTMPPFGGSCADYICAPIHQIAKASDCLSFEECAALPLVGLTAWQALSPHIALDQSNVLIIGGSGGTGHVALQVAKALGAKELVTVCSKRNIDFVKECGATHAIDYHESNDIIRSMQQYAPFNVILDCVTSADPEDARHNYPQLLRTTPGLVSSDHIYQRLGGQSSDWIRAGLARPKIFPHCWLWKDSRERLFWIRFPHSSHELEELTRMADSGQLRPKIQKTYIGLSADTVQQAFEDIRSRRVQGKVVVNVCPDD